jgi:hypothetical protein
MDDHHVFYSTQLLPDKDMLLSSVLSINTITIIFTVIVVVAVVNVVIALVAVVFVILLLYSIFMNTHLVKKRTSSLVCSSLFDDSPLLYHLVRVKEHNNNK